MHVVPHPEITIIFVIMIFWEDCWKINNKKHVFVHDILFWDNQQPKFPGIRISIFFSIAFQKWNEMSPKQ